MLKYKCKTCNVESSTSECFICGKRAELISSEIFWCSECQIPLYENVCSICGKKAFYISTDIRPVFPEERLLIELIKGEPFAYKKDSVWGTSGNRYFINGKSISISSKEYSLIDVAKLRKDLEKLKSENDYATFNQTIGKFLVANRKRYEYISGEAMGYIRKVSEGYEPTEMFVSFSGGKDSTAVSDLVMRALGSQQVLHIYGDTTLEFPESTAYVGRFRKDHPKTPMVTSKNKDKDFMQLCKQLGPPSRVMRWCCTIFKTGAIQRKIQTLFKNQKRILTFYGIRRSESASRDKYDRDSDSPKIAVQRTVSPIIDWLDFDVWLYLLTSGNDFNSAYRLGYTRVGCWCCPNNGSWSEFLSKIYMPEQYDKWRMFLIEFARSIGKDDAEDYVRDGKWKARQGGNGLDYAKTTILTFEPCAMQENTINFELQRSISEELYELFKPFGYINKSLGNERLGEVFVTDKDGKLLLKLTGKIGQKTLKVSILDKKAGRSNSIRQVEDRIKCQITKYQMCMGCLACESICRFNAIEIQTDQSGLKSYKINDDKCIRCTHCITHFDGGCYMRKVVRTKQS